VIPTSTIEPGLAPNGWSWATLRGFRSGEPAALREVYRAHAEDIGKLLRFGFSFESSGRAHRFVGYGSAFELQDALHETFCRAFEPRARQGYDGVRPYAPYLRTIARNVVLRAFRAQRELFPLADEGHGPGAGAVVLTDNEPGLEDAALRRELDGIVREFLDQLPADDRRLLTVRFVEGHSQRDAADALGLGRQQVRSRETRLRAALLAHLRMRDGAAQYGAAWIGPGIPLVELLVEALR
jgi:RNA polymerase sigma factor (sigma-70 family)